MIIVLKVDNDDYTSLIDHLITMEGVEIIHTDLNPQEKVYETMSIDISERRFMVPYNSYLLEIPRWNESFPNPYYDYRPITNLIQLTREYICFFPEPFTKRLFNRTRKCFMRLKRFVNIRRCYSY